MKRIGIIDFDTSHAPEFTKRLNHVGIGEDQWVNGAQVVVGCPGKSLIDQSLVETHTKTMQSLGVPLVDSPQKMLDHKLDAVFIESLSGYAHLEHAKFFLQQKLPLFVDKPFACTIADAEAMVELADKAGVPIFSSSSLRFAPEVVEFQKSKAAKSKTLGCLAYGPAPTHPKNPGLFHYGIHPVEMLFSIMGPGCTSVVNVANDDLDCATGTWSGGRIGTVRGHRPGSDYGFWTIVDGKASLHSVGTKYIYRELLKAVVQMLETGKPPIDPKETLEIVKFIVLAAESGANHGLPRELKAT